MTLPAQKTVLVTGAAGALGSVLTERLPTEGWAVRPLVRTPNDALPSAVVGSVTNLELMSAAATGVSAIVHMGGLSVPGAAWQGYLDTNINGTRTVLEAARICGVPRVVLASSNHAVGYLERDGDVLPATAMPRPDSLYGVSKAAMEALGSFYSDEHGITVANLRIGSSFPKPTATRQLATWLSYPDLVRLVLASIDGDWTGVRTVWGISRNTRRWWSLEEGEQIGYFPQDDAEDYAAEVEGEDSAFAGGAVPPTRR